MIDIQHIEDTLSGIDRTIRDVTKRLARLVFEADWQEECQDRLKAERLSPPCLAFAIGISFRTL